MKSYMTLLLAAAFAVAAVLVVCALLCRQEWQALLLITVAMMYQSQGNYIYCMALIPLAYFLAQEKVMTRQNILPFAVLMVFNLPLPIFEERNSYIRNTIVQLAILTAIIWGVVQAVNCVLAALKTKKPEQSKLAGAVPPNVYGIPRYLFASRISVCTVASS